MLKVGGERVSPREIEDAIIESGLVHETAVIGRPDEYLSEVPEAFVVPLNHETFSLGDLKVFIDGRLAPPQAPEAMDRCEISCPRSPRARSTRRPSKHDPLHQGASCRIPFRHIL